VPASRADRSTMMTNTMSLRPPPQYSVDTDAVPPKYSPEPRRWPELAPRRRGSRPCSRMFATFADAVPWKTRRVFAFSGAQAQAARNRS